jgi:hypothetical protein
MSSSQTKSATSGTILKFKDVDFKEMKFSTSRNKTGRRFISVFYNKQPLVISLPKLRIPFDSQISQYGALEFSLSMDKRDDLRKKFEELDEQMQLFAKENNWFDNDDYRYNPVLKLSSNGNYPPTIKFKIPKKDGEIICNFYDENKNVLKMSDDSDVLKCLKGQANVISIVECAGVWFSVINGTQNFGLFWKVNHLRIYPKPQQQMLKDYIFEESSDDDNSLEEYIFQD